MFNLQIVTNLNVITSWNACEYGMFERPSKMNGKLGKATDVEDLQYPFLTETFTCFISNNQMLILLDE